MDVRFSAGIDVHREKKVLPIDLHPVSGVVKKTDSSFVAQGFSELADRLIHSPLIGIRQRGLTLKPRDCRLMVMDCVSLTGFLNGEVWL